jgi:lipoprotein NlpD
MVALAALSACHLEECYCMKKTIAAAMRHGMRRTMPWLVGSGLVLLLSACGTMRSSVLVQPALGVVYSGPVHPSTASAPMPAAHTPIPGGSYVVLKGDTLYSIAFRNGVDFRDLAQWNGISQPYTIWPGQRLALSPSASSATSSVAATATPKHAVPAAPVFKPVPPPAHATASVAHASTSQHQAPPAAVSSASASTTHGDSALVPVAGVPAPAPASVPPPAPPASGGSRSVSGVTWRWPASGKLASRFKSSDAIPGVEIAGKAGDSVLAAADGVVVYSGNGLVGYGELIIIKHNDSFLSAYGHNRKRLVKEGQRVSSGQQIAEMGSTGASSNELEFQIRKNGNPVDPMDYLPAR